jgi:hypothetical protein
MAKPHLSVSARIYLGFATLVILAVGVGGFAFYQFNRTGTQVAGMVGYADNTERVLEATRRLEELHRAEAIYRATGDAESLQLRQESAARVDTLLTEATNDALSAQRRQIFSLTRELLRAHAASFARFLQLMQAAQSARTRLLAGGREMIAATNKLVDAAQATDIEWTARGADSVLNALLLIRGSTWRFIAASDPQGQTLFATEQAAATEAIARLRQVVDPATAELIGPVETALAANVGDFNA